MPAVLDHLTLGRELGIFTTAPEVGAGLPLWLPAGAAIRHALDAFVLELEREAGYEHVMTPALGKRQLFERSGHWEFFADDMFPAMDVGSEEMVLRPVNCPHHVLAYRHGQHSYRDLPLRIAELGTMYRLELSGNLQGLQRVRAMTLNDAHLFCRPDQVVDEVVAVLSMIDRAYEALGIQAVEVRLAGRTAEGKWAGDPASWQQAEAWLRSAAGAHGLQLVDAPGEAAFYGPKLDVVVQDVLGRPFTLSTVQVDLWMPERFDLTYIGPGGEAQRPVMVHRGVLSTSERMVGYLLEHYQGAFPFWLAPRQVEVLPVTQAQDAAGEELVVELRQRGLRAGVRGSEDGSLGRRIRMASTAKVPICLVLGEGELAGSSLAVRLRGGEQRSGLDRQAALDALVAAQQARREPEL